MSNKQITINLPKHDPKNPAPLYCKYDGQTAPQKAYLELDLTSGVVSADYSGEIGNGMPAHVLNGVIRRYPIRNDLTSDQIAEVINEIKDDLDYIYKHSTTDFNDSGNLVGMLSDSAKNKEELFAANHAEMLGQDLESKVITDLVDWSSGSYAYTPNPNEDVKMYIDTFDLDGFLAAENIEDVLVKMWINDFEHSGETSANIAAFLIENNHCDESMIDDLREIIAEANNKGLENKAPSL